MTWGRNPGGRQITSERGEAIRRWFHRHFLDHAFRLGCTMRAVIFADHRSGWSAVQVTLHFGFWGWTFCPVKWRTPYSNPVRTVSLAEQIEKTHGKKQVTVDVDDE